MAGEQIIIAKAGKPVAVLSFIDEKLTRRVPGIDAGVVVRHPDSDDLLPEFDV